MASVPRRNLQRWVYIFGGAPLSTWSGDAVPAQIGTVLWGANSSLGRGIMNHYKVVFSITGLGIISLCEYPHPSPGDVSGVWS